MTTESGEDIATTRNLRFAAARPDTRVTQGPDVADRRLRLSHIAVYEPSVVPSFDQIGLASLHLDLRVVHHNPQNHKVVAWGVLPFGADDDGATVGVPTGRQLMFAFTGSYDRGRFALEAARPWFEITATPVPLDRLSITGTLPAGDAPRDGGSLLAQVRVPSFWQMCKNLAGGHAGVLTKTLRDARSGVANTHRALPGGWGRGWTLMRRAGAAIWRLVHGDVARAWGLLGTDGQFSGVGTFRLSAVAVPSEATCPVRVTRLAVDKRRREVVATLEGHPDPARALGMLAIRADSETPWPLDYNSAVRRKDHRDGSTTLHLRMPKEFFHRPEPPTEVVVLDHCEVLHRARVA